MSNFRLGDLFQNISNFIITIGEFFNELNSFSFSIGNVTVTIWTIIGVLGVAGIVTGLIISIING